jgi:hypothetical protein
MHTSIACRQGRSRARAGLLHSLLTGPAEFSFICSLRRMDAKIFGPPGTVCWELEYLGSGLGEKSGVLRENLKHEIQIKNIGDNKQLSCDVVRDRRSISQ